MDFRPMGRKDTHRVVDLRYKTKDILACLRRKQKVRLTCRGKLEGVIVPAGQSTGTLLVFFSLSSSGLGCFQRKTPPKVSSCMGTERTADLGKKGGNKRVPQANVGPLISAGAFQSS